MKRPRPSKTAPAPEAASGARRRAAWRFGFSAVIASFVVIGLLILGAMFQEEYEEGFVRLVSYAVRLASPEEIAQAEAQGPVPPPLPAIRPDTPVAATTDSLLEPAETPGADILLPSPDILIPFEGTVIDTTSTLEIPSLELSEPATEGTREETAGNE